jgi:hypothetical protein
LAVAEAVRSTIMKKLGGIMLQRQHVVMPEIGYFPIDRFVRVEVSPGTG